MEADDTLGLLPAPFIARRVWWGELRPTAEAPPTHEAVQAAQAVIDAWPSLRLSDIAEARAKLGALIRGLAMAVIVGKADLHLAPDSALARLVAVGIEKYRATAPEPPTSSDGAAVFTMRRRGLMKKQALLDGPLFPRPKRKKEA